MDRTFKGTLHVFNILRKHIEPVFDTYHQLAHLTIERMVIKSCLVLRPLVYFLFEMLCHVMPASNMQMLGGDL